MAMSGMTDQLGRVLGGRYRLMAPVGRGSSAQVFLADDVTLRRRVAVKVLHPALAADEAFLRRFGAEARAAAALSHPNLMAVYDWGEDDGPYLVLEFLGGGSLRDMLDRGWRLSVAQAVEVGLDAARALDAAHRRSFVHRDIKPANLLFGDDARLRIGDFGLARALSEAAWTEPGDGLVGTARYAAPEQAVSPRIDGKADVYSLGLVLIEAVTGQVPLTADTALGTLMRRVDVAVPVPSAMGPLTTILEQAGRTDPGDRPDAAELARGLLAAARRLDRPAPLTLAGAVQPSAPRLDPTLHPGPRLDPDTRGAVPVESSGPRTALFDDLAGDTEPVEADVPAVTAGSQAAGSQAGGPEAGVSVGGGPVGGGSVGGGSVGGGSVGAAGPVGGGSLGGGSVGGGSVGAAGPDAVAGESAGAESAGASRRSGDGHGRGGRRWRRALLLLAVLAVVAIGAVAAFSLLVDLPPALPTATVPELDDQSRAEAEALLAATMAAVDAGDGEPGQPGAVGDPFRWNVSVRQEPSEAVEAGFVVRQLPEQGTELADGETVRFWVSLGPPLRSVPDLAGRTGDEAEAELGAAELVVGDVVSASDEAVEEGRVVTWRGDGEERPGFLPKGTPVDVVVSSGPAPRSIPTLVGTPAASASAELAELGLEVSVTERFSTTVDKGLIIATEPAGGATVPRGSAVELVVSRGPDLVQVPAVEGLSEDEAIAALTSAGLAAGSSTGPAGGTVFDSEPGAGASVLRGTVVDLFRRR